MEYLREPITVAHVLGFVVGVIVFKLLKKQIMIGLQFYKTLTQLTVVDEINKTHFTKKRDDLIEEYWTKIIKHKPIIPKQTRINRHAISTPVN